LINHSHITLINEIEEITMDAWDMILTGLFTGIGVATGGAFVELWIKPHLQDFKEKKKGKQFKDLLNNLGEAGRRL